MSKLFENKGHLEREERAIKLWMKSIPQGSYKKLGGFDIDFRVYSPTTDTYAYVEVKGRHQYIDDAFPLPIAARKLVKLYDTLKKDSKATKAFVIWACKDGIIEGDVDLLVGSARVGGRSYREGSTHDCEVMVYYDIQLAFKKTMYK